MPAHVTPPSRNQNRIPKDAAPAPAAPPASSSGQIPRPMPAPPPGMAPPASLPPQAQFILSSFQGTIPGNGPTLMYMTALALTASVLVLLFVIYLAFIGAITAGTLYHLGTNHTWATDHTEPGRMALGAILYFTVGFVGLAMVIFMMKPFLADTGSPDDADRALDPAKEPLLFQFVNKLAESVGAPKPTRIYLALECNASASLGNIFGILTGRLRLTLGLPLFEGMNTRELAGVIAHELGHFTQGGGMRLSFLIRSLEAWFASHVFERDSWDYTLRRWAGEWSIFGIFPLLALGMGHVVRGILWVLLMAAHASSCWLLRQMEYDADRKAAMLVGSGAMERLMDRLDLLELAQIKMNHVVRESLREQRLADNLSMWQVSYMRDVPEDAIEGFRMHREKESQRWFYTHPPRRLRLEAIRGLNAPGLFRADMPGTVVLAASEDVGKAMTVEFYRACFGRAFREEMVEGTKSVLARQKQKEEASEASSRYFQGMADNALLPLLLRDEPIPAPANPQETIAHIAAARERLLEFRGVMMEHRKKYFEGFSRVVASEQATALLKGEVKLADDSFYMAKPSRAAAEALFREGHVQMNGAREVLNPAIKELCARLLATLSLLHLPDVMDKLAEPRPSVAEAQRLVSQFAPVCFVMDLVLEMRRHEYKLALLIGQYKNVADNYAISFRIDETLKALNRQMSVVLQPIEIHDYPYEHTAGRITLAKYALPTPPHPADIIGVLNASAEMTSNLLTLYYRILADLVQIAEKVEVAVGLEPLPKPPEEKEEGKK